MKIRTSPFERKSGIREPINKTFLMMEGTKTEPIYFYSFFKAHHLRNIQVYYFVKDWNEVGWSNPKTLLNYIEEKESRSLSFTYETVMDELLVRFESAKNDLDSNLFFAKYEDLITNKYSKKLTDEIDIDTLAKALEDLKTVFFKETLVTSSILTREEIGILFKDVIFDAAIDQVVLIVDRDKTSFVDSQFDYVLQECKKQQFIFLVTNPCFEFFLALHLSDCQSLSQTDLLENKFDISGNTFAYNALVALDPEYSKNSFDAQKYVSSFDRAFENSKLFENDLNLLKDKPGTNIPNWLNSLL